MLSIGTLFLIDNNISISTLQTKEDNKLKSTGLIALEEQSIPLISPENIGDIKTFCKEYDQLYGTTNISDKDTLSIINVHDPCDTKKLNVLLNRYMTEDDYYLNHDTLNISEHGQTSNYRMIAIKNIKNQDQANYYSEQITFSSDNEKANYASNFIVGADKIFYSMVDPKNDLASLMIHDENEVLKTVILLSKIN